MKKQSGLGLVEVLVATALLGLTVFVGFSMLRVPGKFRANNLAENNTKQKYSQAFAAFYRVYNQVSGSTNYASSIEALNTGVVSIRFSNSSTMLTTDAPNSRIEIGNSSSEYNDLLRYRVISAPDESTSFCKFTTVANATNNTWNFVCPGTNGSSYQGFSQAFQNNQISELPIAMLDGRICYVLSQSNMTLRVDNNRNNCFTPTPNNSSLDHRGMFIVPRLIVFSSDKQFSQAIFESFNLPRERFGSSNARYPNQY
jgi:type II secretory pathway pseudopilin PulG